MNNMFSKAAIWVVIALVLFTVFKQFDGRGLTGGAAPVPYSDFLDEVKAKHIKDATIEDRTITATTQDGKKIKTAIHDIQLKDLRSFAPIEIFRGGSVPAGTYSILLRAKFQSFARTLREDEVNDWSAKIVAALQQLGGAQRA